VKPWLVVTVVGVVTGCCKAAGPVLLGGRTLGGTASRVVALIAPVMLAALVVTQTVGGDRALVLDARRRGGGRTAAAPSVKVSA